MEEKAGKVPVHQEISRQELLNWLMPVPWELVEDPAWRESGRPVLDRVLEARGIDTEEKRRELFDASFDQLPDPFLFRSMGEACHLLESHLDRGHPRILIFGDYDADGLTAAALLSCYLTERGHEAHILIPDRFDDGYGLSPALVDEIELHRPDLVITVDTGTSSPDLVRDLMDRGMDVIVTDHHLATQAFEEAGAPLINPMLAGETYPFAQLSGAGVALMLTLALDQMRGRIADCRPRLLVLAAVGTVADVMPLVGVNRIIVREGLAAFERSAPHGLRSIDRLGRSDKGLTARDIAFSLAPRLNAAGRMGDVRLALDLLLEEDPARAGHLARELDQLNQERRLVEQDIFSQALDAVTSPCCHGASALAIAVGKGWHAGVMGIVSSRLVEKLRVPAITLNEEDGLLTGSARSYGNLDLIKILHTAAPLMERYGGHAGAAGLTLKAENLDAFRDKITQAVEAIPRKERQQAHLADIALTGGELQADLIRQFDTFEPTGNGFERPLVWMEDLTVEGMTRVGDGRHLKFALRTPDPSMLLFDALLFNRSGEEAFYRLGDTVEILAVPEINRWRDQETVQMRLIELRPARHDGVNDRAVKDYGRWLEKAETDEKELEDQGLSLPASLFRSLWKILESLCDLKDRSLTFLPLRLAWLLSHRYNEEAKALEVLLALAIFDQAGLVRLSDKGDGSFSCTKIEQEGKRPALSDSPLWEKMKALGVAVE